MVRLGKGCVLPMTCSNVTAPIKVLAMDYILLEPSAGGYENVLMLTDMFSRFTIAVVRPGFNITYNIRMLFVEQKKFCGVSAHTRPATFQASKY